ncbi:ABC transporter ATP-binding protein [Paenibacillus sp. 1011MAR3C5]|uniref:ABC transporter ATP-binding protein n=1 Tax=Paenibacillus sp. 1011MAR3C5 TaxID=1675787 RepID=UPI000E6D1D9A|nr:ABC transporter ATP-binding protein [Paenibacillus sp. 1011MAR3C5]RJE90166.1 ABC transporter ATP-binding protein [Paenibacillus sp. 1011MAR3C5]
MNKSFGKLRTFGLLIPILWKISGAALVILIGITLAQAFIPIAQLALTSRLVEEAALLFQGNSDQGMRDVQILVGLQLALLLSGALLGGVFKYTQQLFNQRATLYFDELLSTKVNRLPLSYFDNHLNYDRLQRTSFSMQLQGIGIIFTILTMIQNMITVIGYMVILFQFHWLLSLGMLLLVVPMLWSYLFESKAMFKLIIHQTPDERMSSYISNLLKSREGAKEIRVFELASYLIDKWKRIALRNVGRLLALERKTIGITYSVQLFTLTLLSGMLLFALHTGANGGLVIGQYVALAQALFSSQALVQGLAQGYSNIHQGLLHANEMISFVNLPEGNGEEGDQVFPSPIKQGITVEHLTFQYDGAPGPAIDGISFSIGAGETIAIVGDNGAGKSTLAKCLLGLYAPDKGSIAVDGVEYASISSSSIRSRMSAIFQDFVQFPFPVWENIGLGGINEIANRHKLQKSSEEANTASFIQKLPQGWDTVLGVQFDGGHELSYGQWQRIALNRAFYREFELIVLDEPTASLDPMTEAAIFENLMKLTNGRTSVFITHRLGSCRFADRIIVLKDGCLVEEGSHDALMIRNGEYAAMFRKQAGWYTKEWEEQSLGV